MRAAEALLTREDLWLLNEGNHVRLWERMGAHPVERGTERGTHFAVWAPNAERVSVVGDFNGWQSEANPLRGQDDSGVWSAFVPGARRGDRYKFRLRRGGATWDKMDPFGFLHETPPMTASVVWDLAHEWRDGDWMRSRAKANALDGPMSAYEVHLGSWRRRPEEGNRWLTYRELAEQLPAYATEMGFTHVEFLPMMEHPFFGSWGYQTTGYFAPTSRFGSPQDFMHLVDELHRNGLGVILDWVPSHFPTDAHALALFDGTHLYEHADPRQGFHPDWSSAIFNFGRHEVRSFLLSSAHFWLDVYHADALRVDAVASMLYLDYSRKAGEWIPNPYGGNENLEAIDFLRRLNQTAYGAHPDVQTIAEESTAWPMVSRPAHVGGLGFGLKWDMGWMHDTLLYLSHDPVHRKWRHDRLTFRAIYMGHENFMLPLSHDEVVHGKGSLLGRMPGDEWQRFANLRLLLGLQHAQPGKKLLFMGGEFGQGREWHHEASLDWHLLQHPLHAGVQRLVRDLNRLHRDEPALHELDCHPGGFEWVEANDADASVFAWLRRSRGGATFLAVANATPIVRDPYRLGVPTPGRWRERLNTDARAYGGSGVGNGGGLDATPEPAHGRPFSLALRLPPLGLLLFEAEGGT